MSNFKYCCGVLCRYLCRSCFSATGLKFAFNLPFVALPTSTKGRLPPVSPWNPTAPFITLNPSKNKLIWTYTPWRYFHVQAWLGSHPCKRKEVLAWLLTGISFRDEFQLSNQLKCLSTLWLPSPTRQRVKLKINDEQSIDSETSSEWRNTVRNRGIKPLLPKILQTEQVLIVVVANATKS